MPARRRARLGKDLSYVQLEKRLVLLAWLNKQFGFLTNEDALNDAKQAAEGFNADGRSHLSVRLETGKNVQIEPATLAGYDANIRDHLRAINTRRRAPITLRYFQYLAALYAEIYLDWFFNRPGALLDALNRFEVVRSTDSRLRDVRVDLRYKRDDLRKLAFWIATGGGKTLLLHLNYHQFLRYNAKCGNPLDSILLVTPNEGLSEQHLADMTASAIPCRRFDLRDGGMWEHGEEHAVRVIEITKLTEVKKGGGLSVPVEAFEGNNLIFVDEGHKGSGGERWRSYRDALAETGFTFEYSATFGQALTAARNEELTREYAKAIAFDYSYRYFHGDGFGKDFNILNLQDDSGPPVSFVGVPDPPREDPAERTDRLLLGNLLAFHEQQRVFAQHKDALRPYNLARPLWVFVGGTVNAVYSRNRQRQSDVLTVVRFLDRVLRNPGGWAVAGIERLLAGESGLRRPDDRDVFEGRFDSLRDAELSPQALHKQILESVLHAPINDSLRLGFVRGSSGEIGLKANGSSHYFGVITIGDANSFRKLVLERAPEIRMQEEAVHTGLFDTINAPETRIEVLVGARKFMEGWNSWRVSSMGLMNVGRKEGSQIIQLFGRGVRLRGLADSLKRSGALPGDHPAHIGLLETLNIFAVRADYMAQFKSYLEREDLHTEGVVELTLPVLPNKEFLRQGLLVPRVPGNAAFADEAETALQPAPGVAAFLDRSQKLQALESRSGTFVDAAAQAGHSRRIPAASLELVDWNRVHLELLAYREQRGYANLALTPEGIRAVFEAADPPCHELVAEDALAEPKRLADVATLSEAVLALAKKYTDRFYRTQQERWTSQRMRYVEVRDTDANFGNYVVRVPKGNGANTAEQNARLLADIEQLIEDGDRLYARDTAELPNIHFDRHLYQPLPVQRTAKAAFKPPALNESEHRFVEDLRIYCRQERQRAMKDAELFLLRNQGRGHGVGFFEQRGFYPDFILWVKTAAAQRIVFVEPHGMLHAGAYAHDDKARLHEKLRELEAEMAANDAGAGSGKVTLDSYIISATPFADLRQRYDDGTWSMARFAERHILFPAREAGYDYLALLLKVAGEASA